MDIFLICLNAVLPLLLIMLTGYIVRLLKLITQDTVLKMNSLAFKIFLPAMCFMNIYDSDLSSLMNVKLVSFIIICVLVNFILGYLYVKKFVPDNRQKGAVLQGTFRTNFLVTALPMARNLVGDSITEIVGVLLFIIVPVFNILSVIAMEIFSDKKIEVKKILIDMLKNPLIESFIAVLILKVFNIRLPKAIESVLGSFGSMASTYALFLVGAFLNFDSIKSNLKQVLTVTTLRLVIFPTIFLTLTVLMGFRGDEFVLLMGLFTSSVAVAAFTMTEQMGGDAQLAGNIVMLTSALLPLTFFLWSLLFMKMGMF